MLAGTIALDNGRRAAHGTASPTRPVLLLLVSTLLGACRRGLNSRRLRLSSIADAGGCPNAEIVVSVLLAAALQLLTQRRLLATSHKFSIGLPLLVSYKH